ncbi:MAG: hypothetical protein HYZ92_05295, partial [Candidatus Omnitrophica bacterium]|nr:hypothetical protein [Candidatus Omnitrophota bacterium]
CRQAWGSQPRAGTIIRHDETLQSLRVLNRFFINGESLGSLQGIRHALSALIHGMQHELLSQETQCFPDLERTLSRDQSPSR